MAKHFVSCTNDYSSQYLIYNNSTQKLFATVSSIEYNTTNSLKEFILSELNFERDVAIWLYGEVGQEILDDEELPEAGALFFGMNSNINKINT